MQRKGSLSVCRVYARVINVTPKRGTVMQTPRKVIISRLRSLKM